MCPRHVCCWGVCCEADVIYGKTAVCPVHTHHTYTTQSGGGGGRGTHSNGKDIQPNTTLVLHTPIITHNRYQRLRKKAGLTVTDAVHMYWAPPGAAAALQQQSAGGSAAPSQQQQQQQQDAAASSSSDAAALQSLMQRHADYLAEALGGAAPRPLSDMPTDCVVVAAEEQTIAAADGGEGAAASSVAFVAVLAAPPGSSAIAAAAAAGLAAL